MATLKEIKTVSQDEPGIHRRWFTDNDYWDLYVWTLDNGEVYGFQLCYDKDLDEKALTWIKDREFSHKTVNPGSYRDHSNRMGTPILVPDGYFHKNTVAERFLSDAKALEPWIQELVIEKIRLFENLEKG
ncbi:MAG: hypothetical protein JXR70_00890 [Spirochaetales bacterium]|nr:hypothetical protein [Spirochaetales bacterium]